jgi:molybdopterin-biosynthesis enzyme MoeA-like protein
MSIEEIGLILIGDELLRGNRKDRHMEHMIGVLAQRGLDLDWVQIIGDDNQRITATLRDSMAANALVFSFGGIGGTPDDLTRACAAAAANVALKRHPEAARLIEDQFGEGAYPHRIVMADIPEGAELIPNPINKVAGFSLRNHHFLPGFPNMSWPMAQWVLDEKYPQLLNAKPNIEKRLYIFNTPESDLIDEMEQLLRNHPGLKLSSLPDTQSRSRIDFGLKGPEETVNQAWNEMIDWLNTQGRTWEALDPGPKAS